MGGYKDKENALDLRDNVDILADEQKSFANSHVAVSLSPGYIGSSGNGGIY